MTASHERLARRLIDSADKCLPGEDLGQRQFRRNTSLVEGGLTLAQWSVDGARDGWLRPTAVTEVRKDALTALTAVLPSLRQNEDADMKSNDSETFGDPRVVVDPVRILESYSAVYRRLAEQEILDLLAAEGH